MLAGCTPWPDESAQRYRRAGYWQGQTFGELLRELADRYGRRIAVVSGGTRRSYLDLDVRADRLATGLSRLGIGPGDRVVVQLPNIVEFFEVCFALFRLGALPVFALPAHRRSEITAFCSLTGAVGYVIPARHAGFDYRRLAAEVRAEVPGLRHVLVAGEPGGHIGLSTLYESRPGHVDAAADPSDVAFFQLSGGSTGIPKLIPRTHDDYLYSVRASAQICHLSGDSIYLCALPVAHNYPLSSPGVLGTLYAGGRVVLAAHPAPDEAFPLIERERVTLTGLVPPLAYAWLQAAPHTAANLSSLETVQVGGAKLAEEVARRIRPVLGCRLQQVFGMAEGLVNYTRAEDGEDSVLTTQGRPISPDDEILVVDDEDRPVPPGAAGHLLTRGPYTIRGYYRADAYNATAFTADGFYRTGDLVRALPSGHLVVVGRVKDQINRGGEKIAAEEVESHLLAHPGIRDAAVVAVADPVLGERTCAYLVPAGAPPSVMDVKRFMRARGLAAYKAPDRVEFVDVLPETAVGKTSRRLLRESLAGPNTRSRTGPSTGQSKGEPDQ